MTEFYQRVPIVYMKLIVVVLVPSRKLFPTTIFGHKLRISLSKAVSIQYVTSYYIRKLRHTMSVKA